MNFEEFRNLDLAEISHWPLAARVIVWVVMVLLIWLLGYRVFVTPIQQQLSVVQRQESSLKQEFEQKVALAERFRAHRDGMESTSDAVGDMMDDVGGENSVAGLLEDISRAGQDNGLGINYFKPETELHKGYYAELPIRIAVSGNYHQFGHFISDLAALPRIVTVDAVHISHAGKGEGKALVMELVVRTYHAESPDHQEETEGKP